MCKKLMLLLCGILAFCLVGSASGALPAGWSSQDVGTPLAGSADESGGVWTITANGDDIWNTGDNCHFAYISMSGSCEVIARVTSVGTGTNNWAKGGVMIRETLNGTSANAYLGMTPGNGSGLTFQIRPSDGASSTSQHTQAPVVYPPHWVRLVRKGDVFTAWRSPDGSSWTQQGEARTVAMGNDVYVGLAVTSHEAAELRTMTFDNVSVELLRIATDPTPGDGEGILDNQLVLAWTAGYEAATHDVYFGDSFDNVMAGTGGTFRGNEAQNLLMVGYGTGLVPDPLEFGTTYYWRIDEIEADGTKHPGDIWSFTTPTQQAQEPQPADGARFLDGNVQLSWTPGFEAMLHTVYISDDYDTVLNASGGSPSPSATYDPPGDLDIGKTYYWRVDETDLTMAEHKGEVWSFSTIPVIPVYDPNLVAWYKMNENEGTRALDWSGHGHHATFRGDPQWTTGFDEGGIEFTGSTSDYLQADGYKGVLRKAVDDQQGFTICAWVNTTADNGVIVAWGSGTGRERVEYRINGRRQRVEHGSGNIRADTNMDDGTWRHIAMTLPDGGAIKDIVFYLDGAVDPMRVGQISNPDNLFNITSNFDLRIGERCNTTGRLYTGLMDDVRVYDKELTLEEIQLIMLRPDPFIAWDPSPAAGTAREIEDATELSWSPGDLASQHDVYLGTDPNAVRDADTDSPEYKGQRGSTTYSLAGEGLEFGSGLLYWRVDQVNTDGTITKGRVWDFTVADYIVIDEFELYDDTEPNRVFDKWIDGTIQPALGGSQVGYWLDDADLDAGESFLESGSVGSGGWSMPYFYNNHSEAILPLEGIKRDWTRHGVTTLRLEYDGHDPVLSSFTEDPQGTYTMVSSGLNIFGEEDSFSFAWKRVNGQCTITARLDYIEPVATGARAGVMIRDSLDPNSINAVMKIRSDGGIRFNRRTEVPGTTGGDSQGGFSIPIWVRIERDLGGQVMAYHANDVGGSWDTWTRVNVVDIPMGSPVYVGLAFCANAGGATGTATLSNVTIDGDVIDDSFTFQDIGIQSNVAVPMFVSLKDTAGQTAAVTNLDPNAANLTAWTQWGEYGQGIALTQFLTENPSLNLASIETMSIGFEGGGSGLMFFDTIRLYGPRCVPELAKPAADFNSNCIVDTADLEILAGDWLISTQDVTVEAITDASLEAQYSFENNLLDGSGNGYTGDPCGVVSYAAGQSGQALDLAGEGYVNVGDYAGVVGMQPRTCTAWIKTTTTGEILSWGQNSATQKWIFRVQDDNGTEGAIRVEVNSGYVVGSTDLRDGAWHHVAAVVDAAEMTMVGGVRLYVDGVQEAKSALDNDTLNTSDTGVVRIGQAPWGNRPFIGQIDDVRIYSRAVPPAEIANLAGMTVGTTFTQPVAGLLTAAADTDLVDDETINFMDYAALIASWLDEQFWP